MLILTKKLADRRRKSIQACKPAARFPGLSLGISILFAASHAHSQISTSPNTAISSDALISAPDVKLNFPPNTSLSLLVDYVSDRLSLNIVYDGQLARSQVTLRTPRPVPVSALRPLLESLLATNGFALVGDRNDGVLRVVPQQQMAQAAKLQDNLKAGVMGDAAVVIEVFDLAHADPTQAEAALRPFLSGQGAVLSSDPQRRQLVVTDVASRIEDLAELVERLDRPTPAPSVLYYQVRHTDSSDLRAQLAELIDATDMGGATSSGRNSSSPVQLIADRRTNRLTVVGPEALVERAIELAQELDVDLKLVPRIYTLQNVTPERVDRLVRSVLPPSALEQKYRATLDDPGGLYVVTAPGDVQQQIQALIAQLDSAPNAETDPIRFYKIQNVDAADILRTIRSIAGDAGTLGNAAFREEGVDGFTGLDLTESESGANPPRTGEFFDGEGLGFSEGGDGVVAGSGRDLTNRTNSQELIQSRTQSEIASVRTSELVVTADPNTNTIIVIAAPPLQRFYEELIERLDVRRPQVLIEATIVTIDTTDAFTLGVEISTGDFLGNSQRFGFSRFGLSEIDDFGRLDLIPGLGFNGAVLQADVADVIIRALKTDARATVVASPRILVNDNATGTIASLSEQPVTSINQGLNSDIVSFSQFVSAGTEIVVTPKIAEADFLRLEFSVSLDSFSGEGSGGVPPPRQSNVVESEVTVPDGSTIVVGGINRRDETETISRIPILGQIPILEHLFSSRSTGDSTATLFVFLKPIILRDDEFADLKYLSNSDLRAAGLSDERIPFPTIDPIIMRYHEK